MKTQTYILFTCSTIQAKYLYSQTPEKYVSLNPKGNNLETDLPLLQKYLEEKKTNGYKIDLKIIIGNTDPYYIYTESGKTTPYNKEQFCEKFNARWLKYKTNLQLWLNGEIPNVNRKFSYQLLSWYEIEREWEKKNNASFEELFDQTKLSYKQYLDPADLIIELNSLKIAFDKNIYFKGLIKPDDKTLKRWIIRKFSEYAVQGLWIKQIWPEAVLLQNEKPSLLRTRMYQPLVREELNDKLEVEYPFGIDNLGFQ